jgi:two-component system sensor histidine kinase KdpD
MQVANDSNLAFAERSTLAAAFSAAESELTADRFSSLHRRQLMSLVLSSAPAMAIVVALAVVGFRQVSRLRGRLEVAEQTSEDREQMVNLASHELRNPLAIISLSAELLKHQADETGDESLADSAQEVRVAALRADALVAELLDLSRLDANRLRLKLEPMALTPILKGAIDVTAQYRGEREVEISMGDESRDLVVADGARLQIVLRNLIDNAFKYSEAGTPVSVDIESRGDHTEIDVYDHGPGVPKGESDAVFSRFSRLEQTSHVGGVGIGMFLSRELARRMGGDLRAFDGEARGHFRLTLSAPPPTKVVCG